MKTFSLMYQLLVYYCRTNIDEAKVISFLRVGTDRQMDRHYFGILLWKHICNQNVSFQSLKLRVDCKSQYVVWMTGMNIFAIATAFIKLPWKFHNKLKDLIKLTNKA